MRRRVTAAAVLLTVLSVLAPALASAPLLERNRRGEEIFLGVPVIHWGIGLAVIAFSVIAAIVGATLEVGACSSACRSVIRLAVLAIGLTRSPTPHCRIATAADAIIAHFSRTGGLQRRLQR